MTYDNDPYFAIRQTARQLLTLSGWVDNKVVDGADALDVLDELCQDLIEISYALDDVTPPASTDPNRIVMGGIR